MNKAAKNLLDEIIGEQLHSKFSEHFVKSEYFEDVQNDINTKLQMLEEEIKQKNELVEKENLKLLVSELEEMVDRVLSKQVKKHLIFLLENASSSLK